MMSYFSLSNYIFLIYNKNQEKMGIKQKEGNGRESAHGISLINGYFQPFRAHFLEIDIFLNVQNVHVSF